VILLDICCKFYCYYFAVLTDVFSDSCHSFPYIRIKPILNVMSYNPDHSGTSGSVWRVTYLSLNAVIYSLQLFYYQYISHWPFVFFDAEVPFMCHTLLIDFPFSIFIIFCVIYLPDIVEFSFLNCW